MKHNTLKKILSLLLVICMMASFAGCIPGEEDPTEPSTIETTGPTESTAGPTDGTTAPTDNTDATTSPTEETQAPTEPTEAETEPPATEAPNTDPTFATEIPTESPVETFVDVVETVYGYGLRRDVCRAIYDRSRHDHVVEKAVPQQSGTEQLIPFGISCFVMLI